MGLLAPAMLWIAAGVVPALLLLYFLKLRRREETVPSTLLWKRAVQDLQVNAPFQRLRKNLLLLLQLLVLIAAILALARPTITSKAAQERSLVLLIDNSASMNTREGQETRLEIAREQAVRLLKTVNRTNSRWMGFGSPAEQTRVMVIAFADRARVVSPGFSTNVAELETLVRGIPPTDERTNLQEALRLADAYMAQTTVEQNPQPAETASRLVLFSDGGIADLAELTLRNGTMEIVRIGQTQNNVGITALRTQRGYERPEVLEAFLEVRNYAAEPVQTDVSIFVDDVLADAPIQTVSLDAAEAVDVDPNDPAPPEARAKRWQASSASLSFELLLDRAAKLDVRLSREDGFSADNRAYAVIPPPRKLSVLFVSKGNVFLESVLNRDALPLERVKYLTPEQYEAAPPADIESGGRSIFDVVIVDGHDTARLPIGNYLFVNGLPQVAGVSRKGDADAYNLIWWDETHPVLRYVNLDFVFVAAGLIVELPQEAQVVIEGPSGPSLARYARGGSQFFLLTFDVARSNWVLKKGFPTFMQNVVRFLAAVGPESEGAAQRPGEALRLPLPPGTSEARVTRPDARVAVVRADESGAAHYAGTDTVGVYRVDPGVTGRDRVAVNLEDDNESNIAPRSGLKIGTQQLAEGQAIKTATPEIWRWFVGAALAIVLLEWYIYNRRVMV